MNKLGGAYLSPLTFFSDLYENGNFRDSDFWKQEQKSWGEIAHKFPHKSNFRIIRNGNQHNIESAFDVVFTIDGLIATELPDCVQTDDEALIVLSNHLSSFLALLNIGGRGVSTPLSLGLSGTEFASNHICVGRWISLQRLFQ
jgi:hypothetical protein